MISGGIAVDEKSRVIGADGVAKEGLLAVGQLTGRSFPGTAVLDIRVQARDIVLTLAHRL